MVFFHLVEEVVTGNDDGIITGGVCILVAIGGVKIIDGLQGIGGIVGRLQHAGACVREPYRLVASLLHTVHDAQHSLVNLVFLVDVFIVVDDVVRVCIKQVAASSEPTDEATCTNELIYSFHN